MFVFHYIIFICFLCDIHITFRCVLFNNVTNHYYHSGHVCCLVRVLTASIECPFTETHRAKETGCFKNTWRRDLETEIMMCEGHERNCKRQQQMGVLGVFWLGEGGTYTPMGNGEGRITHTNHYYCSEQYMFVSNITNHYSEHICWLVTSLTTTIAQKICWLATH